MAEYAAVWLYVVLAGLEPHQRPRCAWHALQASHVVACADVLAVWLACALYLCCACVGRCCCACVQLRLRCG